MQKEIERICRRYGFQKVSCPSLADISLFETSGHAQKFNEELQFFITHLEANLADKEYEILMKLDKNWIKFDLGKRTCDIL